MWLALVLFIPLLVLLALTVIFVRPVCCPKRVNRKIMGMRFGRPHRMVYVLADFWPYNRNKYQYTMKCSYCRKITKVFAINKEELLAIGFNPNRLPLLGSVRQPLKKDSEL